MTPPAPARTGASSTRCEGSESLSQDAALNRNQVSSAVRIRRHVDVKIVVVVRGQRPAGILEAQTTVADEVGAGRQLTREIPRHYVPAHPRRRHLVRYPGPPIL